MELLSSLSERLFSVCLSVSHLSQTGKCVAAVRVALVRCLVALLEVGAHRALLSIQISDSFFGGGGLSGQACSQTVVPDTEGAPAGGTVGVHFPCPEFFFPRVMNLRQADPRCHWAVLDSPDDEENETPVSAIFSSHLDDAHHHIRMLVATSVERYADSSCQNTRGELTQGWAVN